MGPGGSPTGCGHMIIPPRVIHRQVIPFNTGLYLGSRAAATIVAAAIAYLFKRAIDQVTMWVQERHTAAPVPLNRVGELDMPL